MEASEYQQLPSSLAPQISHTTHELLDIVGEQEAQHVNNCQANKVENNEIVVHTESNQLKITEYLQR